MQTLCVPSLWEGYAGPERTKEGTLGGSTQSGVDPPYSADNTFTLIYHISFDIFHW